MELNVKQEYYKSEVTTLVAIKQMPLLLAPRVKTPK